MAEAMMLRPARIPYALTRTQEYEFKLLNAYLSPLRFAPTHIRQRMNLAGFVLAADGFGVAMVAN